MVELSWARPFASDIEPRMPLEVDVAASGLCTWRVGGPLKIVVRPRNIAELQAVSAALPVDVPMLVIGRGSNLLVADEGFAGLCIVLGGEFEALQIGHPNCDDEAGGTVVVVGGGALPLPVLARRTAAAGVTGLEFFVGIPGSVGGAVRMNAGGHGHDTSEVLIDCEVFDIVETAARVVTVNQAQFAYRRSAFGPTEIVTKARFRGRAAPREECETRIDEVVAWRRAHQPGGANAGSVFANPEGDSAGRLIDAAGCKNMSVGGAVVSTKHANFIQANRDATATDIYRLIDRVRTRVREIHGVELRSEVRCVGFEPPPEPLPEPLPQRLPEHPPEYPPERGEELTT